MIPPDIMNCFQTLAPKLVILLEGVKANSWFNLHIWYCPQAWAFPK